MKNCEICSGNKNDKGKLLVKLHIKEAIAIKSIIDASVFDAHENRLDRIEGR